MLNGSIGIVGGKTGPYNAAYYFNNSVLQTYSKNTPVPALDNSSIWQTYTFGSPTTADGFYNNYYFVNGQIDTGYTNLFDPVTATNDSIYQYYLYQNGVALKAPNHNHFNLESYEGGGPYIWWTANNTTPIPQNTPLYTVYNSLSPVPDSSGIGAFSYGPGVVAEWSIVDGLFSYTVNSNAKPYILPVYDKVYSGYRLYQGEPISYSAPFYADYEGTRVATNSAGYIGVGGWRMFKLNESGYITDPYEHPYAWEYPTSINLGWWQTDSPAISGSTIVYQSRVVWDLVTNQTGTVGVGEYGGEYSTLYSQYEFERHKGWSIDERGVLSTEQTLTHPWKHVSGFWFDSAFSPSVGQTAYTSPSGGDPQIGYVSRWTVNWEYNGSRYYVINDQRELVALYRVEGWATCPLEGENGIPGDQFRVVIFTENFGFTIGTKMHWVPGTYGTWTPNFDTTDIQPFRDGWFQFGGAVLYRTDTNGIITHTHPCYFT